MATIATADVRISPDDGWVKAATAPTYVRIRSLQRSQWFVAIVGTGDSAPDADLVGLPFGRSGGRNDEFIDSALSGADVYIRVALPGSSTPDNTVGFGVMSVTA